MGVEDYLVTSTINGVLAQRLVRKLCPHCREPYRVLPALASEIGLDAVGGEAMLYRGRGCEQCLGSGYFGRVAVLEFLPLTDALRLLVHERATAQKIQEAATDAGMISMYHDGLRKARQGVTSLDEVIRVTREI
jgi:general secretion pathway protein E